MFVLVNWSARLSPVCSSVRPLVVSLRRWVLSVSRYRLVFQLGGWSASWRHSSKRQMRVLRNVKQILYFQYILCKDSSSLKWRVFWALNIKQRFLIRNSFKKISRKLFRCEGFRWRVWPIGTWHLKKYDVTVWTGFIWLGIENTLDFFSTW